MPAVIRKTETVFMEPRREILHAVSWQVRSTIWSPPTDVSETDDTYVIRVEIAGMREEDFEVVVENQTLHIFGARPDFSKRRAYHQMEIRFGKFATSVSLPGQVNVEQAQAEYKDGFLTVVLPKEKPNQIKVE